MGKKYLLMMSLFRPWWFTMDKIQNVNQLESFLKAFKKLYDRQSALVIIVESDMVCKRVVEPAFSKLGFEHVLKMEPGKELLNKVVSHQGSLIIWYELLSADKVLEPMIQIVQSLREKKTIDLIMSGKGEDKLSLARALSKNEKNIILKPLEARTIEEKIESFLK